jgi:hypothetical protein
MIYDISTCINDSTYTTNFKCNLLLENRGQETETCSHRGTGFIHTVMKTTRNFISLYNVQYIYNKNTVTF